MDYYDDPKFSYPAFWMTRRYEHEAELMALTKLFGEKRFTEVADIGGGYGRLIEFLSRYARHITLVEPSAQQRSLIAPADKDRVSLSSANAEETGLPAMSCDLALIVRVLHHIPEPGRVIHEMWRIVKPGGFVVIEFANSKNVKSRFRNRFKGKKIPPTSFVVGTDTSVPYVNHNPAYMLHLLRKEGFEVCSVLSVSNIRSSLLKRLLPLIVLLGLENLTQRALARIYFGPGIFVLARRPERKNIDARLEHRLMHI